MNYKLFMPKGAKEFGNSIILENGMSFPRYAFIAVPIVGTKSTVDQDILSELENDPVYFDTKTNTFTLNKKKREQARALYKPIEFPSLSTSSDEESEVSFNFDGYINISKLIQQVKQQVTQIKEYESKIVVFEQDIGYTTVRLNNQITYKIESIEENDNYGNVDYELSDRLALRDLLVHEFRPQTLQGQKGVSPKIIVRNLKNVASNIYEPIIEYLIPDTRRVEIMSAFVESSFYAPDAEFYIGEAIQLRFPGTTSAGVYLYAKELASMLFYSKLYLEYYLDKEPRITIMLPSIDNPKPAKFATRFEGNIIHDGRLVNIDNKFDDRNADPATEGFLQLVPLNPERDKLVLQNFIKDAIKYGYVKSEEDAIKFAYLTDLNISDVVISPYEIKDKRKRKDPSKPKLKPEEEDDPNSEFNKTLRAYLPQLISCPPVSNGSVTGYPDQTIFPMMSSPTFRPITDPTMVYNPDKTAGQLNIPQHIRFNNPLNVGTVEGVTNKPEDGYIGEIAGKAVYANRLGGLCAGLRLMGGTVTPGMSLQTAVQTATPASNLLSVVSSLTQAMFGVTDPTGAMLGCAQVPAMGTDPNMMITMIATMLAAATQKKTSPMTYDEIKLAQEHLSGANTAITRTPGGNKTDETRDPSKEQPNVITKTDQDANTTPAILANTEINSVQKVIIEGKGVELETKSERKESQETTYIKYDSGTNHEDNLLYRGNSAASIANTVESIMI
jgi:hypothetical protein